MSGEENALSIPPVLTALQAGKPYDEALARIADGSGGAGDFLWNCDEEKASAFLVLEPEVTKSRAIEMVPLAMMAVADALAVNLPPKVAIQFSSSGDILINDGLAGRVKGGISDGGSDEEVPDWLVVGFEMGLAYAEADLEPGANPDMTVLSEEGAEGPIGGPLIEAFARHFLAWLAIWEDEGFGPVARAYKIKDLAEQEPDLKELAEAVARLEERTAKS